MLCGRVAISAIVVVCIGPARVIMNMCYVMRSGVYKVIT